MELGVPEEDKEEPQPGTVLVVVDTGATHPFTWALRLWKETKTLVEQRKKSSQCAHVVFHKSYPTVSGTGNCITDSTLTYKMKDHPHLLLFLMWQCLQCSVHGCNYTNGMWQKKTSGLLGYIWTVLHAVLQ